MFAGLNLELMMERYDYLAAITSASGVIVAVHPYNTLAFHEANSITVHPGTETSLALKLVSKQMCHCMIIVSL